MNLQTVEIEAESLEEARKQIYNERYIVLEELVAYPGDLGIVESVGDTVKQAFIKARSRVPAEAIVKAENIRVAPDQITLQVLGDNEKSAGKSLTNIVKSVLLIKEGRKGFLGLGKTRNIYEIVLNQQAVVEIRFRISAKLRATIQDYSAKELLHSVQAARNLADPQTREILQLLNPKEEEETRKKILKINKLYPDLMFDIIENICRKNENANWQTVINDAHLKVLTRHENELKKEKIRLRNLDVEIAESFLFFTLIDWYPKGHREPTGLPKYEYVGHHSTDERLRRTIPKYSSVEEDFKELERRIRAFGLYELFIQTFLSEDLNEATSTLEQKCIAALKARKLSGNKELIINKPEEVSPPNQNIIDQLRDELVLMCLGNREQAERLVNFERRLSPDSTEQQLYESAIQSLRRDNR